MRSRDLEENGALAGGQVWGHLGCAPARARGVSDGAKLLGS